MTADKSRCDGTGTPARNVTRAWIGDRLPVVGDCQICGRQVEITRRWTVKYHTAPPTADTSARVAALRSNVVPMRAKTDPSDPTEGA